MPNLERAIEIAISAHKGQTDKGGNPYILHPLRVMISLESQAEKMVGVLHDVVEDSDWTFEDLENEGFPVDVIDALKSVTKNESEHGSDEGYFRFVERAKLNPIGARVKIADLHDNLDISRIPKLDESAMQRINKYKRSLEILKETKH
jgi:(p)ppGpp synthase/HD superfamily hydrolase